MREIGFVEREKLSYAYLYSSMVVNQLLDAVVYEGETHSWEDEGKYYHYYYDMLMLRSIFCILKQNKCYCTRAQIVTWVNCRHLCTTKND